MNFGDWFDLGLRVAAILGVPGAVVWFVRDRRKSRASDEVAERTVGADVRIRDVGALEAHIAYVERAFEVERESKDRRIADQDQQIKALQEQVQELKAQVALLTKQLASNDEPGEMT